MELVKLTKRGNSYGINIPREYLERLGWIAGDRLVLAITAHSLEVLTLKEHQVKLKSARSKR